METRKEPKIFTATETNKYITIGFVLGFLFAALVVTALAYPYGKLEGIQETAELYKDSLSVDLPEEYQLINPNEQLQGNYDKTTNTLHIWFNNK